MNPSKRLAILFACLIGSVTVAISASAAVITGTLLDQQGQPFPWRSVHLENVVTREVFVKRTGADGTFSIHVAPGLYDLRDQNGPIILSGIAAPPVETVSVGKVNMPGLLPWGWLEQESIAPGLLSSPAPSTANVISGAQVRSAGKVESFGVLDKP